MLSANPFLRFYVKQNRIKIGVCYMRLIPKTIIPIDTEFSVDIRSLNPHSYGEWHRVHAKGGCQIVFHQI